MEPETWVWHGRSQETVAWSGAIEAAVSLGLELALESCCSHGVFFGVEGI
jgi:hypothetical protein